MKRIATILTVFNRREKTLACLRHLFAALEAYNQKCETANGEECLALSVFLTDDGCTDGTAEAVRTEFADKDIHILQGTGSLFWAGGMRLAWQAAIDTGTSWDYYLLLNDDTHIYNNAFELLLEADDFGFQQKGKHGLSSGAICQPDDHSMITYGGFNFRSKTKGKRYLVKPTGTPQRIDLSHANILLVHHCVVDAIGIFYKGYIHGSADFDYAQMASRKGFPVSLTSEVCGECEYDHTSSEEETHELCRMTLAERKQYFNSPTRSDHDYLLNVRRNSIIRYPFSFLIRKCRLYCPSIYYHLTKMRGVYKP